MLNKPIRINEKTKKRMKNLGKKGETYDDIINHLLDQCEEL